MYDSYIFLHIPAFNFPEVNIYYIFIEKEMESQF